MEDSLGLHLDAFGAVEVWGPKWCGKTWMSLSQANSVTNLDDPAVRFMVELDANLALRGEAPHLVDEWQEVPSVWDATRRAVDEAGACGLFLLTSSSTPSMDKVSHSGAGRIARLRMEPMTLFEQGLSSGAASLETLSRDSMYGEDPTSVDRARMVRYLNCLEQNYLVRNLGGWDAPVKARARTRTRPKRYLVDPSLTASVLGYDPARLLLDRQLFGILFGSVCMRDIAAYLAASTKLRQPAHVLLSRLLWT